MTKLYLIRHGLTEWNIHNRFQGSSDIPLCSEGIRQAQKLAERLKNIKFSSIYASDLSRAYETAKIIAQFHNIQVKKIPELREISFGEWEGLTKDEILQLKTYDFLAWKSSPHKVEFPGDGSLKKVQQRIEAGLKEIIENNMGEDIVLVSHGGSLKIAIITLLGLDLSFYNKFWLGNTSLSIIEIRKDRNILSLLNDTSHLETM